MLRASDRRENLDMSADNDVTSLIDEITKALELLDNNRAYYQEFLKTDFSLLGRKNSSAIILSEIITDYYTCLETLFLRISQFFENDLSKTKWHTDLLRKMTLKITDTRLPVISDDTHSVALDILRFRHFRRYYYEFNYDWDRVEYMQKQYEKLDIMIRRDLKSFVEFLNKL